MENQIIYQLFVNRFLGGKIEINILLFLHFAIRRFAISTFHPSVVKNCWKKQNIEFYILIFRHLLVSQAVLWENQNIKNVFKAYSRFLTSTLVRGTPFCGNFSISSGYLFGLKTMFISWLGPGFFNKHKFSLRNIEWKCDVIWK